MMRLAAFVLVLFTISPRAFAGLHYTGETVNPLPAKWKGFLPDQRSLRLLASPNAPSLIRETYLEALNKLETLGRARTADEAADYGAILVRLGQVERAIEILRPAVRQHPNHFRLAANLGTAWQLAGDLPQAIAALEDAVRLAPVPLRDAEKLHLKLVMLRQREGRTPTDAPDALFDRPPSDALALTQQVALWLPADGRVLWQLAELAYAAGDVRISANILDGCLTELGMKSESMRKRRQQLRAMVDDRDQREQLDEPSTVFRSSRPLGRLFDVSKLPPISATGATNLPWPALGETTLGKSFPPTHLKFVQDLDGKTVSTVGYVRPLGADTELREFLFTENAIGCWFCELPEPSGLIHVELAPGLTTEAVRTPRKVTGIFRVNRTDPEAYLFRIENAKIGAVD